MRESGSSSAGCDVAFARSSRLFVALILALGAVACGSTQSIQTPRLALTIPDHWQVTSRGDAQGKPTTLVITRFGNAVIDDGPGAVTPKEQNYETVQAPVEVRLYAWPDSKLAVPAETEVFQRLATNADLQLRQHYAVLETSPPECNRYPRKYRIGELELTPIDLVKRPGWRTIVLGGRKNGSLLGVVARVDFEPADMGRNCFNLRNMQVELQNLLDGVVVLDVPQGSGTDAAPIPAAPPAVAPPAAEPSAVPAEPAAPAAAPTP